jgi:hypothetical protein
MTTLSLALPVLPGGADKLRDLAAACRGERQPEFEDFHRRVGLTAEQWFLQPTPQGDLFILTLEGDPLGAVAKLAASAHPFDRRFKERAREVHGVDFNQPLPGPPPEQVFEG